MLSTQSTAKPRNNPYCWPTWITKLIAGEESCKYKLWFRSNYQGYSKVPSNFNLAKWCEDHTALIERRKIELEEEGYEVFLEDQNSFTLESKHGVTLAGKADIVAIRDDDAVVIDCKTGQQRNSDVTQVKLYMLALPLANEQHRQFPDCREIHQIIEDALVRTAVAKKGDHDLTLTLEFSGKPRAR